jgi:hypothetical protein
VTDEIRREPKWPPGLHHQQQISLWTRWFEAVLGMSTHDASWCAFEIWKLGQKVNTDDV